MPISDPLSAPLGRRRPRRRGPGRDGGQATPIVAVALLLAGLLVVALVDHGGRVVDEARARTAADAAALAGAAEGKDAARHLAEANGGRLSAFTAAGTDVVVRVTVGEGAARARATRDGTWCGRPEVDGPYTSGPCPSNPG